MLPQGVRVGQLTCGQQLLQVLAQGALATLSVRQRQQSDHAPAGGALVERHQPTVGAPSRRTIGGAWFLSDLPASSTRAAASR